MRSVLLGLDLLFAVLAFGLRSVVQWRRTGDLGWRFGRARAPVEIAGPVLLVAGAGLLVAALVAGPASPPPGGPAAGVGVTVAGVALVLAAQWAMGASWRLGVDPGERTELVDDGLYRHVRHPIYTGMVAVALGHGLALANAWSAGAALAVAVGVELQVRGVEEPLLRRLHGGRYDRWAARAGRFVPGVGRT